MQRTAAVTLVISDVSDRYKYREKKEEKKSVIKIKPYSKRNGGGRENTVSHSLTHIHTHTINRVNGLELICRKYVLLQKRITCIYMHVYECKYV